MKLIKFRPPRPAPSIERVGVMASTAYRPDPTRPARPIKPRNFSTRPADLNSISTPTLVELEVLKGFSSSVQYNWAQPSSHGSQVSLPPRPPGQPPSWTDKKQYFPPVTSNAIDDYSDLNMIQTEPQVSSDISPLSQGFSDNSYFQTNQQVVITRQTDGDDVVCKSKNISI